MKLFRKISLLAIALAVAILPIKSIAATPTSKGILAIVPEYNGQPYAMLNDNTPYFTKDDLTTQSFEYYSELDDLGRCGTAYASIGKDLMPTEKRGPIGAVKPSGWHTVKYNGIVDGNYLYNRCHLIGYQLTGENANTQNLITGTRYLNTVGMLTIENMVANYVRCSGNHVLYRVTPIFAGNNLLASGVLMEGYSVEDNGKGICFNVYAYNVQPGISINYVNGDSELAIKDAKNNAVKPESKSQSVKKQDQIVVPAQESGNTDYVLNTNTKKFHYPTCSSVGDMKEKNKEYYSGDRATVIKRGFVPCKRCNP